MLATLEDISFSMYYELLLGDLVPWREFFEELRNVKVLRLCHGLETAIVDVLRQPTVNPPPRQEVDPDGITPSGTPINSNRSQFSLDISPLLEEIVV
jgi:hypothetical protein